MASSGVTRSHTVAVHGGSDSNAPGCAAQPPPGARTACAPDDNSAVNRSSMARKAGSPSVWNNSAIVRPVVRSISASMSMKRQPSARASSVPTVVLPAPGSPISTHRFAGCAICSRFRAALFRSAERLTPLHELRKIAVEVATQLGHAVAAELLEYRIREHDREHRLADDARGRERDHIAALTDRVACITRADVDALQRLHETGEWLHCDAYDERCAR